MVRKVVWIMAVGLSLTAIAPRAMADPLQWATNGHWYEAISTQSLTWEAARQAARNGLWMGMAGHLATITSAEEAAFIAGLASGGPYWLGGYQDPPESSPAQNWHWYTQEAWDYQRWATNEPNDYYGAGAESCLELYGDTGTWNDVRCSETHYLLVEYDDIVPAETISWGAIKALYGLSSR